MVDVTAYITVCLVRRMCSVACCFILWCVEAASWATLRLHFFVSEIDQKENNPYFICNRSISLPKYHDAEPEPSYKNDTLLLGGDQFSRMGNLLSEVFIGNPLSTFNTDCSNKICTGIKSELFACKTGREWHMGNVL